MTTSEYARVRKYGHRMFVSMDARDQQGFMAAVCDLFGVQPPIVPGFEEGADAEKTTDTGDEES